MLSILHPPLLLLLCNKGVYIFVDLFNSLYQLFYKNAIAINKTGIFIHVLYNWLSESLNLGYNYKNMIKVNL